MSIDLTGRDFLKELDFTKEELGYLLDLSAELKAAHRAGTETQRMKGRSIALIFEKSSTRTRCAFEVASYQQGAHVTYLEPSSSQIGHKESAADTAQVLCRMYDGIEFRNATSEIRNPDGSIVFQLKDIEVPAAWSQVASDILAQKYFRKAGVPARLKKVEETSVPSWLWRSVEDTEALAALPEAERYSSEMSAKQVFNRLAGTWTYWGWKGGYFASEEDALAFYEELVHMLATQRCAPNSPQWFNTGLHWAYGIDGPGQGHYYVDFETGKLTKSQSAYEHPQPHACFIQSISDDLVNEGGIMDLWVREARLFKYGSGTGSNFSFIRGENEPLSGGGKSSGLMSFLKIGDRAAGAIKSGGTTRRAAKMVVVDIDHPDIDHPMSGHR